MSSDTEIIAAHYAASDRGDIEGMLAPLADDVAWTEAAGFPYAGTYVGPDAIRENVFAQLGRDWDGFGVSIDRLVDGGDGTVVGIGTYRGTNRASGRAFEARVAHIWRLADGKVVGFEQIVDSAQVRAAL